MLNEISMVLVGNDQDRMLKIQINEVAALERLIGGDNQLEFDIRQNIVEAFTKKHLKGIVNDELIKKATLDIRKTVSDSVTTNTVKDAIENYLKTKAVMVKIDHMLNKAADEIAGKLSDEILSGQLERLVNKRIKERLGI